MADHQHGKPPGEHGPGAGPLHSGSLEGITAAWQEASDAYRDSERRYRELVEYSLGLICTHDLSGTILSINPAAAESLGYRPEHGIGRNLREFLSSDKRDLFDEYLRRIQQHGQDTGLMSVVALSGEIRVWMYRNVLSRGPDGSAYVLGHAIDITERVAAERTLRQSEQALRGAHAELESRVRERTADLELVNERLRAEIAEREEAERSRQRALIEQRDTLAFLANLSDRLAPLVTFEQLLDVSSRLPVPFLADWTVVHLVGDDGTVRWLAAAHAGVLPEGLFNPAVSFSDPDSPTYLQRVISTGEVAILNVRRYEQTSEFIYPAVPASDTPPRRRRLRGDDSFRRRGTCQSRPVALRQR